MKLMATNTAPPTLDRSNFDFLWFLAGPLFIPTRYAPEVAVEKYPSSLVEESGFLWRQVVTRELAGYDMGVVDPYSSDVTVFINLYGRDEGYERVIRQCDGVIACLMPYHWQQIPRGEENLAIAVDVFDYPFVAYSPEVVLSKKEREKTKEVKRFLSVIPACVRIKRALDNAGRKGIAMPTTTRDLHEDEPEFMLVQCPICGATYKSEVIVEAGQRKPKDECPECGQEEITE